MDTLIELYDERPLENVLGVEMFQPQRVVYICPNTVSSDQVLQKKLRQYFQHRGQKVELIFFRSSMYDTDAILRVFRKVVSQYPDCAMDITGGTDAVLFAAGLISSETSIPVFTYSRNKNSFFNIRNADFAANRYCDISYSVEDCFLMAGGSMRKGRVDNSILSRYMEDIDPFFEVFLRYRRKWDKIVTYIQRVSAAREDGTYSLSVQGDYTVKGEQGARLTAPEEALRDLEKIRMISGLKIVPEESVEFYFRDPQVRAWLRDVGSVLELYIYKACLDTDIFNDVRTSAIVDWNGDEKDHAVSNELDVMCTQGITPVFISCKTCMIRTEALNELAVLRDRFGGQIARAAIVTAEPAGASARNRAAELNIRIIDLNDLEDGEVGESIRSLMK